MRYYYTVFDKNYLIQGLALYYSIHKFSDKFIFYVICIDNTAFETIKILQSKLKNIIPISVDKLLSNDVVVVRNKTTYGQFCWVCQPLGCEYILREYKHDRVTYLEADSLFFSDPEILFDEIGEKSVSLVPHNYSKGFDNSSKAGIFCTQFNSFRNTPESFEVIEFWKTNCFMYDKERRNEYPGQFCLNDWINFNSVKVVQHPGAGVAPWNIQGKEVFADDIFVTIQNYPIVFYHFHQYARTENKGHNLGSYPLTFSVINTIYRQYIFALRHAESEIKNSCPTFDYCRIAKMPTLKNFICFPSINNLKLICNNFLRIIRGRRNVFEDSYFN